MSVIVNSKHIFVVLHFMNYILSEQNYVGLDNYNMCMFKSLLFNKNFLN